MSKNIFLICLAVTATLLQARTDAQQVKRKQGVGLVFSYQDGGRWLSWDRSAKLMYTVGVREGRNHGLYELEVDYSDCDTAAADKQGLFSNISTEQLVDSVDKFYTDPVNRQVTIPDVLTYVVEQITGTSASELQKRLEEIRRLGVLNKRTNDE